MSVTKPMLSTCYHLHKDVQIKVLDWTLGSMLTLMSRGKTNLLEDHLFLNGLVSSRSLHLSINMTPYSHPPFWEFCLGKKGGLFPQGMLCSSCVSTCVMFLIWAMTLFTRSQVRAYWRRLVFLTPVSTTSLHMMMS